MPTNEERRRVALKLRNSDIERHQLNPMVSHATVTICGSSIVCIDEESLKIALGYLADLIEPDADQDTKGLYQIGADRITKDGNDTLVLYGDNAFPDVIECDCMPYTRVDRQALLYLARDLEVSVMDSGAVGSVVEMIMNIAKEIRKACGE